MPYIILKFIHVASISAWIGGIITLLLLNRLFQRSESPAVMHGFARQAGVLSMRLFMPAAIITLISGIGMVQVGKLSFGATWVMWGIGGIFASMIIGGALTGRAGRRVGELIARGDADPAAIAAEQQKILTFALLNILLLLSIVWAMVAKPG